MAPAGILSPSHYLIVNFEGGIRYSAVNWRATYFHGTNRNIGETAGWIRALLDYPRLPARAWGQPRAQKNRLPRGTDAGDKNCRSLKLDGEVKPAIQQEEHPA